MQHGGSEISTHAPAGGATPATAFRNTPAQFLLTPLREGRLRRLASTCRWSSFLLTPLREGRLHAAPAQRNPGNFYSRPCGRGDRRDFQGRTARRAFLLTPLREGRLVVAAVAAVRIRISTHAPAGGATRDGSAWSAFPGFHFYSRPCGRGDAERLALLGGIWISTHAPAGGATMENKQASSLEKISTHAPAGGATARKQRRRYEPGHFYSRPCGRGDSNFPQVRHEVLRQIAER